MTYLSALVIREESSMFFFFSKKKREALDELKAKEAEDIVAETLKVLDKTTDTVKKINEKATTKVTTYDLAEKLYYATRRGKDV